MARPVAQKTYDAVMLDSAAMLSYPCQTDFSLDKNDPEFPDRFGALQMAARNGATVEDFDAALGSGKMLTALVQKYGSTVVFPKTIWDTLDDFPVDEED